MAELRRSPTGGLIAPNARPPERDELHEDRPYAQSQGGFLGSGQLQQLWDEANAGERGLVQEARYDESEGALIVRATQDLEPFIRHNREIQVHGHPGKLSKEFRKVATIPDVFVWHWMKEGFNVLTCDTKDLLRRLEDPSIRDFRTIGGRLV